MSDWKRKLGNDAGYRFRVQLAVGSWQLAVKQLAVKQLAVGSWQLAEKKLEVGNKAVDS